MSAWREVVHAFRTELGANRAARTRRRGRAGTAPRCPGCRLFVKDMCAATHNPCQVCTRCCPGGHLPPKEAER